MANISRNEKQLLIQRGDNTYVDVTKYVIEQFTLEKGDVSGVGESGNDGACAILTFKLGNDYENNFSPSLINAKIKYFTETVVGTGASVYASTKANIYPTSLSIKSATGGFYTDVAIDSIGQLVFYGGLPSGVTAIIQGSHFDETEKNPWNHRGATEDILLQEDRRVVVKHRRDNFVGMQQQNIVGNGGVNYNISFAAIAKTAHILKVISGPEFNAQITVEPSGTTITFSKPVPVGTTVRIAYTATGAQWKTVFVGLLGDQIDEDETGVTCQARSELTKIMQRTPVIYNTDKALSKLRQFQNTLDGTDISAGQMTHEGAVVSSGNVITRVSGPAFNTIYTNGDKITTATVTTPMPVINISANVMNLQSHTITDGNVDIYKQYKPGIPLKTFLQAATDDSLRAKTFTIYEPSALNRVVCPTADFFNYKSLWQLCCEQVAVCGEYFGERYYSESEPSRMTIYKVDRANTVPDKVIAFEDGIIMQNLSKSDNYYRDGVIVWYTDEATKTRKFVKSPAAQSIKDMYIPMVLDEKDTKGILNASDAQTLSDKVYSDVWTTPQQTRIVLPLDTDVDLFYLLQIKYTYLYNGSPVFSINSVKHDFLKDTTECMGTRRVLGSVKKWFNNETKPGAYQPITPTNITSTILTPPPFGIVLMNESVERYGQIVSIGVDVVWKAPIGFIPSQFQLEVKKSTDTWANARVINIDGKQTSTRIAVDDNTSYSIRMATKNKDFQLGNYSIEYTYVTADAKAQSREVHIRTQEQLTAWYEGLTFAQVTYGKIYIYENPAGPYTLTRLNKIINKEKLEFVGVGNVVINTTGANNSTLFIVYTYWRTASSIIFDNIDLVISDASSISGKLINCQAAATDGGIVVKNSALYGNANANSSGVYVEATSHTSKTKVTFEQTVFRTFGKGFSYVTLHAPGFGASELSGLIITRSDFYNSDIYIEPDSAGSITANVRGLDIRNSYFEQTRIKSSGADFYSKAKLLHSSIVDNTFHLTADRADKTFIDVTRAEGNTIRGNKITKAAGVSLTGSYYLIADSWDNMTKNVVTENIDINGILTGWTTGGNSTSGGNKKANNTPDY